MTDLTRRSLLLSSAAIPLAVAVAGLPPAPDLVEYVPLVWKAATISERASIEGYLSADEIRVCWEYIMSGGR